MLCIRYSGMNNMKTAKMAKSVKTAKSTKTDEKTPNTYSLENNIYTLNPLILEETMIISVKNNVEDYIDGIDVDDVDDVDDIDVDNVDNVDNIDNVNNVDNVDNDIDIDDNISISYFEDYENLRERSIGMNMACEWINNSIVLISNGGNSYFLTRNSEKDNITNIHNIFYKIATKKFLLSILDVKCNIENPNFDIKYWTEHKNDKNKKDLDTDKMEKYLFSNLGPNKRKQKGLFETLCWEDKIPTFSFVHFYPFLERIKKPAQKEQFNTFTGYPMDSVELTMIIDFTQSAIYKHIKEQLMDNNDGEFNHFLDHVADIIQDPANIKKNGHLFVTSQNYEKELLIEFIFNLIGSEYCVSFWNKRDYYNRFNANQENKILKVFELSKNAFLKKYYDLQSDQSTKSKIIEHKRKDPYRVAHYARFWYFSNENDYLSIENDNRRNTCHRSKNTNINNIDNYELMQKEVHDIQFCKNAFEFFATRKYTLESVYTQYDNKLRE